MFVVIWDIFMDWGLRFSTSGGFLVRERHHYPKHFYWFAIVSNTVLRFAWTLTLIDISFLDNPALDTDIMILLLCVLEIYRRAQWTIFRIENERSSNYEKYRKIDIVPKMHYKMD
jgi:hypothetical protein